MGCLLGVDRDPRALEQARERLARFGQRVTLVEGHYSDVRGHAEATDHLPADGWWRTSGSLRSQLDHAERGFSFQKKGPIDMRMGPSVGETAADLRSAWT